MKKALLSFPFLLLLFTLPKAQPVSLTLTQVATGFNNPVDIAHAGDDRLFIVEQDGVIHIIDQNGNQNSSPFLDIDSKVNSGANERGLLGLAFHPKYNENGYLYVNYNNSSGSTVIARYSVSGNPEIADPASEVILMTISQPYSNHNGGCLRFGADDYLYIGMGDGGSGGDPGNNGQSTNTMLGKMLRIDVNGPNNTYQVPADNPFVGTTGTLDEIWATGMRNPWRFNFDRYNGDLWIGDVGQNAWEEVDFQAANSLGGENYGWRCYEGNSTYNSSGCSGASAYKDPVYTFSNNFQDGCSVVGGYPYRGARYGNLWGIYFFADYCSGKLWYITGSAQSGFTTTEYAQYPYAFSAFGEDIYGQLYLTDHSSGRVFRLEDNTCNPHAQIDAPASFVACGTSTELQAYASPGLTYQWYLNGSQISGATSETYTTNQVGFYQVEVFNGACTDISDSVSLSFTAAPSVSLSGLASGYALNDPAVTMTGSPAGGVFSGAGVSGNQFNPAMAGNGTHEIIYTYTNGQGCSGADTISVVVGTTALDLSALEGFSLSPNPGQQNFNLKFYLKSGSKTSLEVRDIKGKVVFIQNESLVSGTQRLNIQLPELPSGIYFMNISTNEGDFSQRFVIKY